MEQAQRAEESTCGASALSAGLERMVREAGWSGIYTQWVSPTERESITVPVTPGQVAKFAELIAAAEREACAKACEADAVIADEAGCDDAAGMGRDLSDKIRKRSNVELKGG